MSRVDRPRVCWITTTPFIANSFLRPHLSELARHYDMTLALNLKDGYALRPLEPEVSVVGLALQRKIAPVRDLVALVALISLLARGRYDAVHTFAPKAGLLGMLAAWLTRVPVRLHTFQGEVWASKRGLARLALKTADRLTALLATQVLVVGEGERRFLRSESVLEPEEGLILGDGSIAGVDLERFQPDTAARTRIRAALGASGEDVLLLYLGRLVRDKGVLDLAAAFALASARDPGLLLAYVGPDEEGIEPAIRASAGAARDRLRFAPYVGEPEAYLAAADIVCLPSHREGFSTVLIEAAACGVPVLAADIYGTEGAVVDGVTGHRVSPRGAPAWGEAILGLARDEATRERMGRAARSFASERYSAARLTGEMRRLYRRLLGS